MANAKVIYNMCGITGFVDYSCQTSSEVGVTIAGAMSRALLKRGPDDYGVWTDPVHGVFIAHQRLSIVDLSPAGHQPMASASGRYVIVFNGEVYNHHELRKAIDCSHYAWQGNSDTETILAAIEHWGLRESLRRFVGMFAFALWDRRDATLTLVRDRFGEKPLYWAKFGSTLLFGSELKSMREHPIFKGVVDRDVLAQYMTYGYVPGTASIYKQVHKLKPGSFRVFQASGCTSENIYWSAVDTALTARANELTCSDAEAVNQLEVLVNESVSRQLLADVPVGAFLSGGVDSSTIVALAQAHSRSPVKTFTIGFEEQGFNEADYAKAVASHLGTDHTECYLSHRDALDVIPILPDLYDEPFADVSQIPTYLVSKLARGTVTVSLSGDAGDELFCGYTRYKVANRLMRRTRRVPDFILNTMAAGVLATPISAWNSISGLSRKLKLSPIVPVQLGDKLHKFARVLRHSDTEANLFEGLLQHWHDVHNLVVGAHQLHKLTDDDQAWRADLDFMHRMMLLDTVSYLTDDILVKVDRAAMGVSLESRVPFLDHRIFEFSWRLPLGMKMRDGQGKWLLRQILHKYVPRELIERPKMGFGVPIDAWIRGPLKGWAANLLDPFRINQEGYLDAARVKKMWDEHQGGLRNWQKPLWCVLMFQAWLEKNRH